MDDKTRELTVEDMKELYLAERIYMREQEARMDMMIYGFTLKEKANFLNRRIRRTDADTAEL